MSRKPAQTPEKHLPTQPPVNGGYVDEGEFEFYTDDEADNNSARPAEASPLEVYRFLRQRSERDDRDDHDIDA